MHETNGAAFAAANLATAVTLHHAERGDPEGEAITFLHGHRDSFSRALPMLLAELRPGDRLPITRKGVTA